MQTDPGSQKPPQLPLPREISLCSASSHQQKWKLSLLCPQWSGAQTTHGLGEFVALFYLNDQYFKLILKEIKRCTILNSLLLTFLIYRNNVQVSGTVWVSPVLLKRDVGAGSVVKHTDCCSRVSWFNSQLPTRWLTTD